MRTLNKNKQRIYYALKTGKESETSSETIMVDGEEVVIDEGGYDISYTEPEGFLGNISFSSGESQDVEFGLDLSAYDAVIVTDKGTIPITETSLIWFETEPPTGENDGATADYTVVAVRNSLNQTKAILKRRVKDGNQG